MSAAPKVESTAVAPRDPVRAKLALIDSRLKRLQPHLAAVLPELFTPERMVKLVLWSVNRNPALLACTAESIAEGVMQVATWGLELGRTAHLVPYGDKATAIADYKGKIELAVRGKSITSCRARVVYERDAFEVEYGLVERLVHKPTWRDDPGKPVGVYAIVVLPNGETKFDLMSADQVEKVRQRSKAKDNGPWKTDPAEMWKKTVVHRLLKMVPQNPLLASAFEADREEQEETGEAVMSALSNRGVRGNDYDEPAPGETAAAFAQAEVQQANGIPREMVDMAAKPPVQRPPDAEYGDVGPERTPADAQIDAELAAGDETPKRKR